MKEVIALMVFLAVAGLTIPLAVKKRIGTALTAIFLIFSLVSAWTIANYDWIQRVQWEVPGLEVFQKQVLAVKEDAFKEVRGALGNMRKEVAEQKGSIELAVSKANEVCESMETERKAVDAALGSIRETADAIKAGERDIKDLYDRSETIRQQVAAIHQASSELALSLTRLTWLLLEAREEYGAERTQAAVRHIMDGLDEVVGIVITDPRARAEYVAEVMNSIPPRQQQ